ncbi:hypothetical protein BN7_519 [Wickerhamomyces ciferrii]|uniref:FAD/NAD(P)-binding domain-containing protein n=1 Tax=Wickerhamomyces ciferrii (strain ATCC 14091 / BCRC 22168 / CBS 111 / JCM 3599 / NBRC 0793 / NRRL Y-1031 F-60-10) TaxID=1206466 RepID=K0KFH6_WICCF|nr:uncharacterized protein BN7_519 [Wickerhamomyces ciferrii]CCH40982.1 hypothetical protein BN7_519 [Wickerhamomyces ciferrii]
MVKIVVIIGGGFYGISTAKRLSGNPDVKVKLINASNHAYFYISSIRVPVQNKTEGTFIPIKELLPSDVEIINDVVEEFNEDEVLLQKGGKLEFDSLVIATGSKWTNPIGSSLEFGNDHVAYFNKRHKELEAAKHIILVGGGFNNTELVGELIHQYQDQLKTGEKRITIIHSQDLLLPNNGFYSDKLRTSITNFIKNSNVELKLNSKAEKLSKDSSTLIINGDPSSTISGDYIIYGTGTLPAVPSNLIKGLTDSNGFILVDDSFRVKAISNNKVFSIGDVTDFEFRGLMFRNSWLNALVNNIKLTLEDQDVEDSKLHKVTRPKGHVPAGVSLGPNHGFGQIPLPWFGTIAAPSWFVTWYKSKNLVVNAARRLFNS